MRVEFLLKTMQIKLFTIPATDTGEQMQGFNAFLANHKVLEIEQKFFQNEKGAYWCFCVRYLEGMPAQIQSSQSFKPKVDYKEVLTEQEFAIFSVLRQGRKQIATEDVIPAYAIFTDEELAAMSKLPELSASKLIGIKGIGDKKAAKYGEKLIEFFHSKNEKHETGQSST